MNVYEFEVGMRRFCGTAEELARAAQICRARYNALSNREQNNSIGISLTAHCNTLEQASRIIVFHADAREKERQRIEDAHRQLRELGAEQSR